MSDLYIIFVDGQTEQYSCDCFSSMDYEILKDHLLDLLDKFSVISIKHVTVDK